MASEATVSIDLGQLPPPMGVIFKSPLRVERVDGGWKLLEDFTVAVTDGSGTALYHVPAGFETDFASVPRVPIAYMAVGGRGVKASTLHDWLYAAKVTTRERADAIFREALMAEGESIEVADLMWSGVRIGGDASWEARLALEPALQPAPSFPG